VSDFLAGPILYLCVENTFFGHETVICGGAKP
jgi:hypothetical protein